MQIMACKNNINSRVVHIARTNGCQHKTLCGWGAGGRLPTAHFIISEITCPKCLKIMENLDLGIHNGGLNGPGHRDKMQFVDLGDGNYQAAAHTYGDS